jgi:pullulanase
MMRNLYLLFSILFIHLLAKAQVHDFSKYPVYNDRGLGLTLIDNVGEFRIWSPPAEKAELLFYASGTGGTAARTIPLLKSVNGTWVVKTDITPQLPFYVFRVMINGKWSDEIPDPYAKIVGVNGRRALAKNLDDSDPEGWERDRSPEWILNSSGSMASMAAKKTAAVIYELHVRDASIHASSGIGHKGKFLGLTEPGTKNNAGLSTGLDHLKELGVTHIHLLPSYDFHSVDESKPDSLQYNWGYDPLNYNTPEGSYATNAYDGITRIKEFKQLVKTFHDNGLRVILDVAYNHTMFTEDSWFNQLVPGYYYRQKTDGTFSDATACGNETASERPMMRKFILESMMYWVNEFHIDGFRLDLMGVHDIETINIISSALHKIKPDILIYGEGWTAGASPLPDSLRALKKNAALLDRVAVFSDDIRDGIKGSVFRHEEKGFASGRPGMEESIKFGITAACKHPQVDYKKVNYSQSPYAREPYQTISYCECHDNHVLWDKLAISAKAHSEADRKNMHLLALSIVLTSQGISFLHAGTEFLRTKFGVENSYNSGDSINAINWELKSVNKDVYEFTRNLIAMRKAHPAFRMASGTDIAEHLRFVPKTPPGVVAYQLNGAAVKDSWRSIVVIFNGSGRIQKFSLPKGKWSRAIMDNSFVDNSTVSGNVSLQPFSTSVFFTE